MHLPHLSLCAEVRTEEWPIFFCIRRPSLASCVHVKGRARRSVPPWKLEKEEGNRPSRAGLGWHYFLSEKKGRAEQGNPRGVEDSSMDVAGSFIRLLTGVRRRLSPSPSRVCRCNKCRRGTRREPRRRQAFASVGAHGKRTNGTGPLHLHWR